MWPYCSSFCSGWHKAKARIPAVGGAGAPAAAAVTLIFALHPIAVETVAAINYSSDLLVTCFTLLALLAALRFRPENFRGALLTGGAATFWAFAAVTCKESAVAIPGVLIVYWFLFRRDEPRAPWLWLLGAISGVTGAFLAARFLLAAPGPAANPLHYLGGSFLQVFWIQPRLWVFMMGKLFWPVPLSADYTLEDLGSLSSPIALILLIVVISLQGWLARRSRLGALGVALFWLALATVSNFMPLHRLLADRFYYLPLAGLTMQLLALLLMTLRFRAGFWLALAPCLAALAPLTFLTVSREHVFSNDLTLWRNTVQASPLSSTAYCNLGFALGERGRIDEAIISLQRSLEINPDYDIAHNDLGLSLLMKGRWDEARAHFLRALQINPNYASAHCNLGADFLREGQPDKAVAEFETALELAPHYTEAHYNLGTALLQEGRLDEAISEFQRTLEIDPGYAKAHNNLGNALNRAGRPDEALAQFEQAVESDPGIAQAHYNLGNAFVKRGRFDEAVVQFQMAVQLDPQDANARNNLAVARGMAARSSGAK
jgi:tetratricopeptide (TPR) repeat protein